MSPRKITTTLALLVGCVAATLAVPASAFAAQSHSTVAPASCTQPYYDDGTDRVAVALCGSTVTAIGAQTYISFYGHMEFYGPYGFIGNSPDEQWYDGSNFEIPINQGSFSGSLWCVRLWERTSTGYVQLDNNCVTL